MATQTKNNKTIFTQSITKSAKIKFMETAGRLNIIAIKHDLDQPGLGNVLDKLIVKFADSLSYEDFFPELYTGNELKQPN